MFLYATDPTCSNGFEPSRNDIEERIERMTRLIEQGLDVGWYPLTMLLSGLHQDDEQEYGTRYTSRSGS